MFVSLIAINVRDAEDRGFEIWSGYIKKTYKILYL
jgi:hypothetical protein